MTIVLPIGILICVGGTLIGARKGKFRLIIASVTIGTILAIVDQIVTKGAFLNP